MRIKISMGELNGLAAVFLWTLNLILMNEVGASGFDKPVIWSGRAGGLGGASVSFINGPESLAYNPAGLATAKSSEVTLALSPFLTQRESPVVTDTWSKTSFVVPGGILYSHQIQEGLGIGAGVYASGGGANDLGNVNFGSLFPTLHPQLDTQFQFLEFSVGAGYELLPGLRIGAAWRILMAQASLHLAAPVDLNNDGVPDVLTAYSFENLKDTNWAGFRLGAQYEPESKCWGLGATYRSAVKLRTTGTASGQSQSSGSSTITLLTGGSITLATQYPWSFAAGGHIKFAQNWKWITEYSYTHYSSVDRFMYSGDAVGGVNASAFTTQTNWMNLYAVRLGAEYLPAPDAWAFRAGWAILTQVTPNDRAPCVTLHTSSSYRF